MCNQLLNKFKWFLKCFCSHHFLFGTNLPPQNTSQWLSGAGAMVCWQSDSPKKKEKDLLAFANFCGVNTPTTAHLKPPVWFTEQRVGQICWFLTNRNEPTPVCHCGGSRSKGPERSAQERPGRAHRQGLLMKTGLESTCPLTVLPDLLIFQELEI